MANFNRVILMGNLTRDPELRYVPSGQAVTTFTVAMNRQFTMQSGEKREEVTFVRVVTWGRMAEVCAEYLTKGSPVLVEGRLQSRSWETPQGEKRSTLEVVGQTVKFVGRRGPGEEPARPAKEPEFVPEVDLPASMERGQAGVPARPLDHDLPAGQAGAGGPATPAVEATAEGMRSPAGPAAGESGEEVPF